MSPKPIYCSNIFEDARMFYFLRLLAEENSIVVFVENATTTYWHMLYIKFEQVSISLLTGQIKSGNIRNT